MQNSGLRLPYQGTELSIKAFYKINIQNSFYIYCTATIHVFKLRYKPAKDA